MRRMFTASRSGQHGTRTFASIAPSATGPTRLSMEDIVSYCKQRGFIWAGSELYGSIGTGYDYGPLGVALKRNVQQAWWRDFVDRRPDCMGIETTLLMNPRVWEASGHVKMFVDPLTECATCRKRARADKLVKAAVTARKEKGKPVPAWLEAVPSMDSLTLQHLHDALRELAVACPHCGAKPADGGATGATGSEQPAEQPPSRGLGAPRTFNLLFKTHVGPVLPGDDAAAAGAGSYSYLRPETAQGAFIHFANAANSMRKRLPFGLAQVGKSFRNEISVGNFLFRTREFDQMELEYFCEPSRSAAVYESWKATCMAWLQQSCGIAPDRVRMREYAPNELAHYALATADIEYAFPHGWDELWGIANRGDYDLQAHTTASGIDLRYKDPVTNKAYFPHVIEPALGLNRLLMAILSDGLQQETVPTASGGTDTRTVFKVHPDLAPVKVAVLPLLKKDEQIATAEALQTALLKHCAADMDVTQSIGKRYRRQDEIGTPLCVTVDPGTAGDGAVTVRDRDSMTQVRMPLAEVTARAAAGTLTPAAIFTAGSGTVLQAAATAASASPSKQ